MPDDIQDDGFEKQLETAFNGGEEVVENPVTPAVEDAKKPEPAAPATPPAPAKVEEPKKDEPAVPADPNKKDEEPVTPPADPAKPAEEDPAKVETPEAPQAPAADEPKPLTEEGVRRLLQEARTEERNSGVELQNATSAVMDAYYPDGLSNVLVDEKTGKQLRTPQDVVDAARAQGGEMTTEEAAQWLMNEQYALDQNIANIKKQAETIAETNVTFRRDAMLALQKYEPLFKAYPQLQTKAYNLMMKQVNYDEKKDLITKAPDVMDLYDTYLEPYQQAYEFSTQQPATNPVTPPAPAPATPGINDRLDEGGDGGANTEVDDPNDFAQQVSKELAKGI